MDTQHAAGSSELSHFVYEQLLATHADLSDVVEAVGSPRFGEELLNYLRVLSGADHCAVFLLEKDSVSEIATGSWDRSETAHRQAFLYATQQHWRKDPMICEARGRVQQGRASILRMRVDQLFDGELRHLIYPKVRERIMICGRRADAVFGLSILRTENLGVFSDDAVGRLAAVADLLVALLAKHAVMLLQYPRPEESLASLEDIECCMVAMSDLPRREMEVCARIVYGLSAAGIAVELGIASESVKTYRSRAYRRLSVGCERELLKWYLGLWGRWRGMAYSRVSGVQQRPIVPLLN